MLSGIKTGKKKKRAAASDSTGANEEDARKQPSALALSLTNNQSVADQLRQALASGGEGVDTIEKKNYGEVSSSRNRPHHLDLLERRGRIHKAAQPKDQSEETVVVMDMPGVAAAAKRGGDDDDDDDDDDDEQRDWKREALGTKSMSTDEEMARNVVRIGKKRKYKMNDPSNSNYHSDEEDQRMLTMMMPEEHPKAREQRKHEQKSAQRHQSRELARHDRQSQITSKCHWWLESSQFAKHRLIALGNHVSLVMAPLNLSLTRGNHLYLVPIQHAESMVACEDEVWDELRRFQTSLRNMYQKEFQQGVLFSETVLPTNNFWQTKWEVIPLDSKICLDSELYFKSALTEQAEEFGTHTKLMSTKEKGLRRTVPNNFPYFYIEWDGPSQGYAQIIESNNFPPDFAVDTIAGMAQLDPVRFHRKRRFSGEEERRAIVGFLEKWKPYDWTVQLDE